MWFNAQKNEFTERRVKTKITENSGRVFRVLSLATTVFVFCLVIFLAVLEHLVFDHLLGEFFDLILFVIILILLLSIIFQILNPKYGGLLAKAGLMPDQYISYRSLVEHLPLATYIVSFKPVSSFTYLSPQIEELLGYPLNHWREDNKLWESSVHPEDRENVFQEVSSWKANGTFLDLEYRMLDRNNKIIWVLDSAEIVRGSNGEALYAHGYLKDITESKIAEEILRDSEERFRKMADNAPALIWMDNQQGENVYFNERFVKFTGKSLEQLLGIKWLELVHPNDREFALSIYEDARAKSEPYELEYRVLRYDGEYRWLLDYGTPRLSTDGQFLGYIGCCFDVSDPRQANMALRQTERRLSSVINSFPLMLFSIDREGRILFSEGKGLEALELQEETLDGIMVEELENYYPEIASFFWILLSGNPLQTRLQIRDRYFDLQGIPQYHYDGSFGGALAVILDITEQKKAEDALRRSEEQFLASQRLESIGRLAGGIAHDFNNLLTAINGYAELLLLDLPEPDGNRESLLEIKNAADRATSLTRQLLAFSRKQVLQPRTFNLNQIIDELEKMLKRLIGEDIELITILNPDLYNVKADPGQVEQVILNLVVNARDAMPNGGKIIIETANAYMDPDYVDNHNGTRAGEYALLTVSDTGSGMTPEIKTHIFEPFFTTKEAGKGTGLGLSTVYGIIKQSGGNIWVYSEPGLGSTFKIYLPRIGEETPIYQSGATPTDLIPTNTTTILLVEDEDNVRKLVRRLLESYQYRVLEANNGATAFELLEKNNTGIDLLLTDVVMPLVGGPALAANLRPRFPGLKVIYMSGHTDKAAFHNGLLDESEYFLQKPFNRATLALKLKEVLGNGRK
jgi:PAS domain S-box-containing protein